MSGDLSDVLLELLKIFGLGLGLLVVFTMIALFGLCVAAVFQHLWQEHKKAKAEEKQNEEGEL